MSEPSIDTTPWLDRWRLIPDGWPFQTLWTRSVLQPVRQDGQAAMLKLALYHEEVKGADVMTWWAGEGGRSGAGARGPRPADGPRRGAGGPQGLGRRRP
ncbi:aminoglycoside phosphotransferase family protein [Phenylobacterium sp. J367]|uniref:aminoglycoside phosphotransferase family protein n=1 Tax=Phenylobacterium sp. J367 TaxID=2898435 RepID=UPI00215181C1|nr:aminoglycoside phosphotransferase family protein [Phenylobacterium sp. J367]MCR5880731.1 hypothetical protein [Phenylobacterium sp. J367]